MAGTAARGRPREWPPEPRDLLWGDLPGRRIRRDFFRALRQRRVTVMSPAPAVAVVPAVSAPCRWARAERAHRRLSWAARLARNAPATEAAHCTVTLWGIPPQLAASRGLPSLAAA